MLEMLSIPFMRQAFLASLLMAAMLAYFGVHVVRRRIVFVDLAIAQLSAVGVAVAMLIEKEPIGFSLAFTLAGAALLSLPAHEQRIPQEAIMGIVYAVASAVAVLVVANMPHGEADVLNLFFGNILAVTTRQIGWLTAVFVLIGLIHATFAKQINQAARPAVQRQDNPLAALGWNLLFYLTLAIVIAIAIRIAGVLLVFSDLIIPAVIAILLAERNALLFLLAVGGGLLGNGMGLYASYRFDLPTGPSIVVCLGLWLVLVVVGKALALTAIRRFGISKT
jgi:zinc/manganese transport system permease protein